MVCAHWRKKPITETTDVEQRKGFLGRRSETVQVEETVGHEDTRAFIMKAPFEHSVYDAPRTDYVVATPDGVMLVEFYNNDTHINAREVDFLKQLTDGTIKLAPERSSYEPKYGARTNVLKLGGQDLQGNDLPSIDLSLRRTENSIGSTFNSEVLSGVIQASIAKTESPHKANLESVQADAQLAQDAVSSISALPPRQ